MQTIFELISLTHSRHLKSNALGIILMFTSTSECSFPVNQRKKVFRLSALSLVAFFLHWILKVIMQRNGREKKTLNEILSERLAKQPQ
jgi:hypothetical protein